MEPGWVKWALGCAWNAEGSGQPQGPEEHPSYSCKCEVSFRGDGQQLGNVELEVSESEAG